MKKNRDPDFVQRVHDAYKRIGNMKKAGAEFGVSEITVWRMFKSAGLPVNPVGYKHDWKGPKCSKWKGDNATYSGFHQRVVRERGTPSRCENCGTTDPASTYDWANMTGAYQDVNDYKRMCRSCHWTHDGIRSNFTGNTGARLAHRRPRVDPPETA